MQHVLYRDHHRMPVTNTLINTSFSNFQVISNLTRISTETFYKLKSIKLLRAMKSMRTHGRSHRESKVWCCKTMAVSFCVMATASVRSAITLKWSRSSRLEHSHQQRHHSSQSLSQNYYNCNRIPMECHRRKSSRKRIRQQVQRHTRRWKSDRCTCSPNKLVKHSGSRVRDAVATIRSERICDDTSGWSAGKSHAFHAPSAICGSSETTKWTAIW